MNGPRSPQYVVDFFHNRDRSSDSNDSIRLKADNDSDAMEQARWLARRTVHQHYQIRAAAGEIYVVIYASAGAMAS